MINLARVTWRKSSRSNGSGGQCVELADVGDRLAVRDSKCPDGGVLVVDRALLDAVKSGRFER